MESEKANPEVILVLSVIVTGFFCIFGFIGNILSLAALFKDKRKNSNVYLLSALTIADWFMLLSIFNGVVVIQFCKYYGYKAYLVYLISSKYALPVLWIIGCIVQVNTIWYVVAVTMDRYVAVCCPFKSIKKSDSVKRAKKVIASVLFLSVLFNIPRMFHFYSIENKTAVNDDNMNTIIPQINNSYNFPFVVLSNQSVSTNMTLNHINRPHHQYHHNFRIRVTANESELISMYTTPSESYTAHNALEILTTVQPAVIKKPRQLRHSKWYHYIYYITLSWFVLYIIPMCALVILNILLVKQIKSAQRTRIALFASIKKHHKTSDSVSVTANIIAVVTTFIICQSPDFIHTLISHSSLGVSAKMQDYMKAIAYAFLAFNSSVNFIIYCLFYQRFRRTVFRMFYCFGASYSADVEMSGYNSRLSMTSQTNITSNKLISSYECEKDLSSSMNAIYKESVMRPVNS